MSGDAYDTLARFWELQNDGDYTKVVELFADDAVLVDPIFGTFTGREAIGEFMAKMNVEMKKAGASFRLEELAGDDHTVWAQWIATTNNGERTGVGVYRVANSKITYYRDYMNG